MGESYGVTVNTDSEDIRTTSRYDSTLLKWLTDVKIVDSSFAISTSPTFGAQTVTTTAAAIYAGSSQLSGRYAMTITNVSSYTIYLGASGVTTSTGLPLAPGESITWSFSPLVATSIYAIAAASSEIRVGEFK